MLARPPSSPKRRFQPGLVPAALAAAIVVGAVSYALVVVWLLHMAQAPQPQPSPSARPLARKAGCPTQVLSGAVRRGLGFVAWVEGGTLRLVNLATCQQRVLVPSRAAAPIRFSPDGRWVAFGPGLVVASSGGQVEEPFGIPVRSWEWSTTSDVLAGVTAGGGLSIVAPGGVPRVLLRDGSSVRHIVFAPDGRDLALDRAGVGVQVLNVPTGAPRTILPQPDRALVPRVAGWFPDGRWVLYWRGPVRSAGGPLDAVPVTGGGWVNVWGDVLPYQDFISPCGHGVAITAGNGAALTVGKQIFLSGPPDWRFRDLSSDTTRSWFWPACSSSGRWVAVTDDLDQPETPAHTVPRALWLLASSGSSRRLLVPGFDGAPEDPRWSNDGRVILVVVRNGTQWRSPGSLVLVQIDPRSGRLVRKTDPIALIGSAPGPGGHQAWASITDWHPTS